VTSRSDRVCETAADYLNNTLGFGLDNTSYVTSCLLVLALVFQLRARRYVPGISWLCVVLISVVGTLGRHKLADLGVPLAPPVDPLHRDQPP
jgi:uncharacterized membrane-anchored protein